MRGKRVAKATNLNSRGAVLDKLPKTWAELLETLLKAAQLSHDELPLLCSIERELQDPWLKALKAEPSYLHCVQVTCALTAKAMALRPQHFTLCSWIAGSYLDEVLQTLLHTAGYSLQEKTVFWRHFQYHSILHTYGGPRPVVRVGWTPHSSLLKQSTDRPEGRFADITRGTVGRLDATLAWIHYPNELALLDALSDHRIDMAAPVPKIPARTSRFAYSHVLPEVATVTLGDREFEFPYAFAIHRDDERMLTPINAALEPLLVQEWSKLIKLLLQAAEREFDT